MPLKIYDVPGDDFKWASLMVGADEAGALVMGKPANENREIRVAPDDADPLRLIEHPVGIDLAGLEWDKGAKTSTPTLRMASLASETPMGLVLVDGGAPLRLWERAEKTYGPDCESHVNFAANEDGGLTFTQFDAGVLRLMITSVAKAKGDPSDPATWERTETYFDDESQKQAQFEMRANGVSILREYRDGLIQTLTIQDVQPSGSNRCNYDWDTVTLFYGPNGQLEGRETLYDNGDINVVIYEDGQRSLRLQYSSDPSAEWFICETVYDENAQVVEVNTFNSHDELPPEYELNSASDSKTIS